MGYFCANELYSLQDKRVLRTCGGILDIGNYEPGNTFQEQAHHNYNNALLAQRIFSCM